LEQCSAVLQLDAGNADALRLLAAATAALTGSERTQPPRVPAGDLVEEVDWEAAEADVEGIVEPASVDGPDPARHDDAEARGSRLRDVGGLEDVKRRLDNAFLTPMRNPELRSLYGRSLPGGLLLYGPPGCGKTFLARAIAGELDARFYAVSLADVLDM